MSKYATTSSLEIIMLGTSFDTATTALMNKMIIHAENECDKYISKRYDVSAYIALTLTSIPPLLTSLTETLSEGYYFMRNSRGGGKDSVEYGKMLVKQAQENLMLIANRKLDLLDTAGNPVNEFANASFRLVSNTTNYSQTINEDDELKWTQDGDKLDDIESGRL